MANAHCGHHMGKKRKLKQKPSAMQAQDLEELLRNGEAVLHGQACWSIANRGTDRPRPGNVITLEGETKREATVPRNTTSPARASRMSNGAWV